MLEALYRVFCMPYSTIFWCMYAKIYTCTLSSASSSVRCIPRKLANLPPEIQKIVITDQQNDPQLLFLDILLIKKQHFKLISDLRMTVFWILIIWCCCQLNEITNLYSVFQNVLAVIRGGSRGAYGSYRRPSNVVSALLKISLCHEMCPLKFKSVILIL